MAHVGDRKIRLRGLPHDNTRTVHVCTLALIENESSVSVMYPPEL